MTTFQLPALFVKHFYIVSGFLLTYPVYLASILVGLLINKSYCFPERRPLFFIEYWHLNLIFRAHIVLYTYGRGEL